MSDADQNQNFIKMSSKNQNVRMKPLKPKPKPPLPTTYEINPPLSSTTDTSPNIKVVTTTHQEEPQQQQPPPPPQPQQQKQMKIKVEYERVGSFEVFETICPLEYFGRSPAPPHPGPPPPSSGPSLLSYSEMNKENYENKKGAPPRGKSSRKSKKNITRISIMGHDNNLSSESEDEVTAAFNAKLRLAQEEEERARSIPITMDAFYRSENCKSNAGDPMGGEATVYWAKGDCPNLSSNSKARRTGTGSGTGGGGGAAEAGFEDGGGSDESELDGEIAKYIESQEEKKRLGENVSGEMLWYDQERSIIRNLHNDGSISLTSYGDTDEKIFGKTQVFDAILTCEERAMLRAINTDEAYVKIEKKKKVLENKKMNKKQEWAQSSRPKDQGDWI